MCDDHAKHLAAHPDPIIFRKAMIPIRRTFWQWLLRRPIQYREFPTEDCYIHLRTHMEAYSGLNSASKGTSHV